MLSESGSSPVGQASRTHRRGLLERTAFDVDVDECGDRARADDGLVGGEQRQRRDGVGLSAAEVAGPFPADARVPSELA